MSSSPLPGRPLSLDKCLRGSVKILQMNPIFQLSLFDDLYFHNLELGIFSLTTLLLVLKNRDTGSTFLLTVQTKDQVLFLIHGLLELRLR